MQKKIELDENRTLLYSIMKEDPYIFQIREDFEKNGYPDKYYYFNRNKNYEIGGYTVKNDVTDLTIEIDNTHPLYIPFVNLLSEKDEIIINDDRIKESNRRYLKIYRDEEKVYLKFVNNIMDNKNRFSHDKFNIFIKNIYFDKNSKLDQMNSDIKYRLHQFFIEVNNMMMDVGLENEGSKKYVKKITS